MKIIHTFFSLVVTILTVSCYGHGNPALLEEQPGPAVAGQYTVRLAELDEAGASAQQGAQFFKERGAGACWEKLQQLDNSTQQDLVFELERLQQGGVADEVMAGVIRYLARYHPRQVNSLAIRGSIANHLTALDPAIGKLKNLTMLYLRNNQLQALPTAIGGLTNLTALDLAYNQLTEIPTAIGKLKNLTKLSLANNQLTELPTAIGKLTNLTALELFNNQLTCLSDSLYPLFRQGRFTTSNNPWLQPADLSMITRKKLEKIAETQLDAFHDTMNGMAEAAMRTEKFRVNLVEVEDKVKVTLKNRDFHRVTVFTLLPHLLHKGQWNRNRSIVFFEGAIPFYVAERQLCSQQDVNNILQDLEGKQLYRCLHGSPRSSSKEQPERKRRRYS